MSGGTKSNRLIAEAMVRRGHQVNLVFSELALPWPKPWRVRRWLRKARAEWSLIGKQRHQLETSTANLIPVREHVIRSEHVPDADVTIATWWETREWIEDWPESKGIKAYFVRAHEIYGGPPERVAATYRLRGSKFVISKWLQKVMAERYGDENAVHVPNGLEWPVFDSEARQRSDRPTIGMLYGQQPLKGAAMAFEAFRKVEEKFGNVHLIAIGSKPLLKSHRPPKRIEFHMRPAQTLIPKLYQRCDCWIVPSTTEGFGMPGLEAAAGHCPIVSTRCGGPEDYVVDGQTGFLVPVGDASAMADAICRVLSLPPDAWRAMSEASYQKAREFDWDRSAEILERALMQSIGTGQASQSNSE